MNEGLATDLVEVTPVVDREDELIRQAQSGDTGAFCVLAESYERRVYSLALHYSRNPQDAEDLSQEVWLKAYQALSRFRGDASFYTWLRKIMINSFLNHRRAKSFLWRGQLTEVTTQEIDARQAERISDHVPGLEATLENRILAGKILAALSEITPQQRLIFLLKHHEGMTYAEIASALSCSTGTVKKSLSRTVAKLRTRLNVESESTDYVSCADGPILI
jgi:RNA polymerase sigma-70 factor, ECF subfamily